MLVGGAWGWDPDWVAWDWGAPRAMEPESKSNPNKRLGIERSRW